MALYRCGMGGKVAKTASGTFSLGTTTTTFNTNHGFIPDLIIFVFTNSGGNNILVYSPDINGDSQPIIYFGSVRGQKYAIGNTTNWMLKEFTDNTMTVNRTGSGSSTYNWYAYKFE